MNVLHFLNSVCDYSKLFSFNFLIYWPSYYLYSLFCSQATALEVQDKISFIMNNLSAANIEVKAKEIVEILKEEHYPWFAQYIVMKRLRGFQLVYFFCV